MKETAGKTRGFEILPAWQTMFWTGFSRGLVLLSILFRAGPALAEIKLDEGGKFGLYGDFRFRFENDFDSERANGAERADRQRLRIRARIGFNYRPAPLFSFGVRFRTGAWRIQQSPHVTIHDFEGSPKGPRDLLLDKYYFQIKGERSSAWVGRNSYPFWKQNELFWDDDVTVAGFTGRHDYKPENARLSLIGGFYFNTDGMDHFVGNMVAGQVVYGRKCNSADFNFATGLFFLRGEEGARNLLDGNGARDYDLWTGDIQAKFATRIPMTLGLDLAYNLKSYSPNDPDPFTAANHDQKTGAVVSVRFGNPSKLGGFVIGYYYAWIETFAVHASYAEDDWLRFGNQTQTAASDFQGHEIRGGYAPVKNMLLLARLYIVDAITTIQDGSRFRFDFNYEF